MGVWASGALSRRVPGLEGGGRAAVLIYRFSAQRSGVIADFGHDAGGL